MKKIQVLLILMLMSACGHKSLTADVSNSSQKLSLPNALYFQFMNKNIRPQDDFYNFVNGKWMQQTKIPADRSRWGSFDELRKNTDRNTLAILKQASQNAQYSQGTDQRKAIDYFASIMDISYRNKAGINPIEKYLNEINSIKTLEDVLSYMMHTKPLFASSFINIVVWADMKNSTKNILYISPSGLGLPERDYYVSNDEDAQNIRKKYQEHIGKMFQFIGKNPIEIKAAQQNIMRLEMLLAKMQLTKEALRKPENIYNPMSINALAKLMPNFNIKQYFEAFGISTQKIIVTQPKYMQAFSQLYQKQNLPAIKDYLTWNLLRNTADKLSIDISDANWAFYGKTLEGLEKRRSLEERALLTINNSIGEALGKLYVDKLFPPQAKQKAQEMISYLQKAYKQRIANLSWMSEQTKQKAIQKVAALQVKIAYPDKWKDYSKLTIISPAKGGNYFDNSLAVSKWQFEENIAKLNKPVDKSEWDMAPQIVNAYYNSSYNEIVFPAAILQPPFYDYKADEAVNYGGIGAVIGHEISHGFDDQGAKFNAQGNFEQWWTRKDFEKFNILVKKLANQYSKIEVLPGVFVNGEFTSGENIGDLGGVNSAYTALQLYYKDHQKPKKIHGFSPEQRFFMSWATIWRTKSREEALKKQIKTDPHSPGQIRATQPLKNVDAFYKAFDIKKGDGMYIEPELRVKIW